MRADLQKAWDEAPAFKDIRYPGEGPGLTAVEGVINNSEEVKCILKCMHTEKKGMRQVTLKCTAVVTTEAIYLLREGTFTKGLSQGVETVPLRTITGISRKRQLGLGTVVEISRASNVDQLIMCNEAHAEKWVAVAKEVSASMSATPGVVVSQTLDPLDQIKKLKDLLDAGILSQAEFDEKKKSLMDKI